MSTTSLTAEKNVPHSTKWRWWFGSIVMIVVVFGWWFPYLGLVVPVVMGMGVVGGVLRGRYVCGNFCPRGSFLDTWMSTVASNRQVPDWMRTPWFRGVVMASLMGFLFWRLSLDIGSLEHWGVVFWQMCLLTTLFAIAMGLAFRERAWCMICPMGSMQAMESRGNYNLVIDASCKDCNRCTIACPMQLPVSQSRSEGALKHRDCIKCSQCVSRCPVAALSWPE